MHKTPTAYPLRWQRELECRKNSSSTNGHYQIASMRRNNGDAVSQHDGETINAFVRWRATSGSDGPNFENPMAKLTIAAATAATTVAPAAPTSPQYRIKTRLSTTVTVASIRRRDRREDQPFPRPDRDETVMTQIEIIDNPEVNGTRRALVLTEDRVGH
jgi:hypothetical protein